MSIGIQKNCLFMYIEIMSNVVSIFGEFQNPEAKKHEKIINAEVKESLEHF